MSYASWDCSRDADGHWDVRGGAGLSPDDRVVHERDEGCPYRDRQDETFIASHSNTIRPAQADSVVQSLISRE